MFVAHPRVVPGQVARRGYQEAIAAEALARNTLVILPTGMGKTVVALLVLAERLREGGRAVVLAPTKPLVEQHAAFLGAHLVDVRVAALTGEVDPADREAAWAHEGVVCSTPQVMANDLRRGAARLEGVRLLVLDEAHRAVGDYAYAALARRYRGAEREGRILGMTASPGAQPERVAEVVANLGIEGIEVRGPGDPDVAPYLQPVHLQALEVQLPPTLERVADLLRAALRDATAELQRAGVLRPGEPNRRLLLEAQRRLSASADRGEAGQQFHLLSAAAKALKLDHAVELAETQSLAALRRYLERLREDPSRAAKAILRDARVEEASRLAAGSKVEHPKPRRLALVLQEQLRVSPSSKAIVFAHYRDTAEALLEELGRVEGLRPVRFVGQASKGDDKGLSQREQQRVLEAFRAGEHNVLVATSVAEEGLDIPATDLVVFYEPVPSEIRSIQRRGRTGRHRPGRVVVLLTKGTRDVASYWVARRKEQAMRTQVEELRAAFGRLDVNASWERPEGQRTLADFGEVRVDHRVANGPLAMAVRARGVALRPDTLAGATFQAPGLAVRVVDAAELSTPSGRARVAADARALAAAGVLLALGEAAAEGEAALRGLEGEGVRVQRARDASEAAAWLAGRLEAAA